MAAQAGEQVAPIALNLARIVHRLLTNPRGWMVDELKEEFGIADRTYRKYRRILDTQFSEFRRPDGSSMVEQVQDIDGLWLRLVRVPELCHDETRAFTSRIAAMHFARQMLSFVSDTDMSDALGDLFADMRERTQDRALVYGQLLRNVDRMLYLQPDAPKDYTAQRENLAHLLEGLFFSRVLRVGYYSASTGREREILLRPLTLLSYRSALYLLAQSDQHEERVRTFAVDRIRTISVENQRFSYPAPTDYDPERFTEGSFGIFREDARKPIRVRLRFVNRGWLKTYLQERRWHPTQHFEEDAEGRLIMTFRVTTMVEVWPWVRSFGGDVELIEPRLPAAITGMVPR